jgi:putative salt-induced outer membrane protein YdiY
MQITSIQFGRAVLMSLVAAALAAPLPADVVETKNGARIVGKVVRIADGSVAVETDFAGLIAIKQSQVTSVTTDAPVAVRLASGTRIEGRLTAGSNGALQIAGTDGSGTINTTVEGIAASWAAGGKDPAIAALERSWAYEAAIDVTGRSGNRDQLGTAASVRATLKTAEDTLQFYTAYDRQETDGLKSADQFRAGVDYQNNFSGRYSWYLRNEGGFDRVKDIELYNVAAAGFGYDVIKKPNQLLTTRAGLSFRYEGYRNPLSEDVKSAGLDFGLAHELTLGNSKLVNRISIVPAFDDFANYRLTHESFLELPLAAPSWKLRMGVGNDYNSTPPIGVEKMDTTYFTRLVLSWR